MERAQKPIQLENSTLRKIIGSMVNQMFSVYEGIFPETLNIEEKVQVHDIPVRLKNLSTVFDNYRIVHLSDIHLGTWIKPIMLERLAALINSLAPQLIVIGGDLVSSATVGCLPYYQDFFLQLQAEDGILVVRGNHDCYADKQGFANIVRKGGGVFLDNEMYAVVKGLEKLNFVGLDCSYYHQDDLNRVLHKLDPDTPCILIVHEPDKADHYAASRRINLQLSGHTHGGQIRLPWIGSPWLPRAGRKYPRGLYHVNGMLLYTNSGIGTSSAHLRVRCPAEIALVRLVVQDHLPSER